MNSLCLLLLCSFLGIGRSWGQALRGSYLTAAEDSISSITLFRFTSNQFFYQYDGCFGSKIGEGTFVVQDGQLRLAFRQAMADTVRHIWPLLGVPANSSTIRVLVTDWKGTPLPGVVVRSKLLPHTQSTTGATGVASLSYHPLPSDELLVSAHDGYAPVTIPLRNAGSQGYRVRVDVPFFSFYKPGDKLTFQLRSTTPEAIVMRPMLGNPDADESSAPYGHYQAVSAEEASKRMRHLR